MADISASELNSRSGPTPARPTIPSQRIDAIDVVRGLALFGVLAINLTTEFRVSIFTQFLPKAGALPPLDAAVEAVLNFTLDSKAFALFSLLFGVGLAIQFDRLRGNPRQAVLLVRRLAVLLAIGLAHLFLVWNGDILTEYALAGFVVLPFLFGSRDLLAVSALLWVGLYLTIQLPSALSLPDAAWMSQHVAAADRVYGMGTFLDILAFQIREIPAILPLHIFVFPRTVALFLFGAFVWRTGILRRAWAHSRLLLAVAIVGIATGCGFTAAADLRPGLFPLGRAAPVLLAIGYGATVIGLMSLPTGRRFLGWAAPLGRMAFTNYLVQSIILSWLFYGYGFGLFGRLGAASALAIGVTLYAAQVAFSAWWLRHYWYGPVEWFWRTLMYGVPQVMRAKA